MVISTVIGIQNQKALNSQQPRFVTSVKTGLLVSLKRRCEFVSSDDHYVIISTVLDPRYKLKCVSNPEESAKISDLVRSQYGGVLISGDGNQPATAGNDDAGTVGDSGTSMNLYTYLLMPFTANDSVAKFWKEHKISLPNLHKLQERHHPIPSTSSAIERAFSCAGLILSESRNRFSDEMFEQMLVANLNSDLMQ